MEYHLILKSKNLKEDQSIAWLLLKLGLNQNLFYKSHRKKRRNPAFSLLKSPHVNKKAQEQFGMKSHASLVKAYYNSPLSLALSLKKIKHTFPGVSVLFKTNSQVESFKPLLTKLKKNHIAKKSSLSKNRKALSSTTVQIVRALDCL